MDYRDALTRQIWVGILDTDEPRKSFDFYVL